MNQKIINLKNITNNFTIEVNKIFDIFNQERQGSIRLVGGCVRDIILGKAPEDFDFACQFLPAKSIDILRKNNIKSIETGIKYGTITALIGDKTFEITTLRKDSNYNGRHPKTEFIDDYYLDAKRRDFTINALFLDQNGDIYDYFDGVDDLNNNIVKFIGNPEERIKEDYLRILRFFRFSCFYAAKIDDEALKYCIKLKDGIDILSPERIRDEFFKFFKKKSNNLGNILSIFDKTISDKIFDFSLQTNNLIKLCDIENNYNIIFSDITKFSSLIFEQNFNSDNFELKLKNLFNKVRFSKKEKCYLYFLIRNINNKLNSKQDLTKLLLNYSKDYVINLLVLQNLDDFSKIKDDINFVNKQTIPNLPINGQDLLDLGFFGPQIGEKLEIAQILWVESNFQISKEELTNKIIQKN